MSIYPNSRSVHKHIKKVKNKNARARLRAYPCIYFNLLGPTTIRKDMGVWLGEHDDVDFHDDDDNHYVE